MTNHAHPNIDHLARVEQLIASVGGSEEIARLVIDEFILRVDEQLNEVSAALRREDFASLKETAHRFKGSLSAIYAVPTAELASTLEKAAKQCDHALALHQHELLCEAVRELVQGLTRWRGAAASERG